MNSYQQPSNLRGDSDHHGRRGEGFQPAVGRRARPTPAALLGILAVILVAGSSARADKGLNDGIFRDREGKQNAWSIQKNHTLIWNELPYVPAGLVFHSQFLRSPTEDALKLDLAELDRLKAAGVLDVWVDPQRGLLDCTVAQVQTVVDALESRGFRYGLRVGDHTREPLIGFAPSISPISVPVTHFQPKTHQAWDIAAPHARRVVYNLVDQESATMENTSFAAGETLVEGNSAHVEIDIPRSSLLGSSKGRLYAVPEIQLESEDVGAFGDLWSGMGPYLDRLKKQIEAVHFGSGFRFVLDPFLAGDGTVGQEENLFPSSSAFQQAFGEWLKTRSGLPTLNGNWQLRSQRVGSWEEAARLIPLWSHSDPPEGDGWVLDPVTRKAYRCKPRLSTIWNDLDTFRADTLKRWMNVVSATLKQDGVTVPMLFTWAAYHPIFTNTPSPTGYDGLGAEVAGAPETLGRDSAAYALAQAEEADRCSWLIATRLTGPPDPNGKTTPVADESALQVSWNQLRDAGFRGVFLDPLQVPNALQYQKELLTAISEDAAALKRPIRVCFFPVGLATSDRITRLSNGVWWLPSGQTASLLQFGDNIMGYSIGRPFGEDSSIQQACVLWSTSGAQAITIPYGVTGRPEVFDSAGAPLNLKVKKDLMQVALSDQPVVITGVEPEGLFPIEVSQGELREFDELLREAEAERIDVTSLRVIYNQWKKNLTPYTALSVYSSVAPYVSNLRDVVRPTIWVEGEHPGSHNFNGSAFLAGCSGGMYLRLDRPRPPLSGFYKARYTIEVRRDASYEIWIAGRVPGSPGVSPLVWQVDDEPAGFAKAPAAVGGEYIRGMSWYQLGRMTLKTGKHELLLAVTQKAAGPDGKFSAGVDAILFSRDPFHPDGIRKPSLTPTPVRTAAKSGKGSRSRSAVPTDPSDDAPIPFK